MGHTCSAPAWPSEWMGGGGGVYIKPEIIILIVDNTFIEMALRCFDEAKQSLHCRVVYKTHVVAIILNFVSAVSYFANVVKMIKIT